MTEKFPIGFWNYTSASEYGPEAVKDWHDLGMTLAMSPEYRDGRDDKAVMLRILDECEKFGIKVILCDSRTRWGNAAEDPEGYEKRFLAAYEDFGRHKAVFGFHIGDEPHSGQSFGSCIAAYRIQLRIAPGLVPFINFLPYWEGIERDILKTDTFGEWACDMAEKAGLKLLCYDCYSQMNPEESGTHGYFRNLLEFSKAAKVSGIPFWTTLLSVGHFRYREPDENDFRWQLNTAAASGCKGILWFFIYMRTPTANYRLSPVDEFRERTESFGRLSRVNRHFLHRFGDFFRDAVPTSVWHSGKAYGGYPLFGSGSSGYVTGVECDRGLGGVVSFFEKDGQKFIAVVNNSPFESGCFKVHVSKKAGCLERLGWSREFVPVRDNHWDAYYAETDTEEICGDWYAPGQMNVYRYMK